MECNNKRFRDESGKLILKHSEVMKLTQVEGEAYYTLGNIYLNNSDNREYVLCGHDGVLIQFTSFDGHNLFIPLESCGTFLPDVASEGLELIKQLY